MTTEPRDEAGLPEPSAPTTQHVRRALGGHAESVDWIVARFSPLLLAQASYRLPREVRAWCEPEDLVNETWIVALPRLDRIACRDGRFTPTLVRYLSSTLLHLANNIARKHIRREAGRRASPPGHDEVTTGDPNDRLAADQVGVVTRAVHRERRSRVMACLEELAPKDREVILLRGIEQQSSQVVALLLGLTPEAVAMRYSRALKRLRERLPSSVFHELADE